MIPHTCSHTETSKKNISPARPNGREKTAFCFFPRTVSRLRSFFRGRNSVTLSPGGDMKRSKNTDIRPFSEFSDLVTILAIVSILSRELDVNFAQFRCGKCSPGWCASFGQIKYQNILGGSGERAGWKFRYALFYSNGASVRPENLFE